MFLGQTNSKKGQGADALSLLIVLSVLFLFFIVIMVIIRFMAASNGSSPTSFKSQNYNEFESLRYANSFFNAPIDGGTMSDLLLKYYVNEDADSQDEFNQKANDLVQSTIGNGKCFTVFINGNETFSCQGGTWFGSSKAIIDSEITYPIYDGENLKLRLVVK